MSRLRTAEGRGIVDSVLDVVPVTDIVYHDLRYTEPLVKELADRVRRVNGAGRLLVVAPNAILPRVLVQLGYDVDIWHVPEGVLADEEQTAVTRRAPLDDLLGPLATELATDRYDVIVLPHVLDRVSEHPTAVLARLARWLKPHGHIIAAYRRTGSLGLRLRALLGHAAVPDSALQKPEVSFSWPPLPARRTFGPQELVAWSLESGLRVLDHAAVMDRRATLNVSMDLFTWLGAHAAYQLKTAVPQLRDSAIATLSPFPGKPVIAEEEWPATPPLVSVIVACAGPDGPQAILQDLAEQVYPPDRLEVILLLPPGETPVGEVAAGFRVSTVECARPDGPVAANAGARLARGAVLAFTDDCCRLPPGWIEAGASSLTGWTGVVTGIVHADAETAPRFFLRLPGARQTEPGETLFPAANSFYSRNVFEECGGFDTSFETGPSVSWGWDTQLAYRLQALGYPARFEESVFVTRRFPLTDRRPWIAEEYRRSRDIPAAVRRSPGLSANLLKLGVFASKRTLYFDLLVAGACVAALTGRRRYALLGVPFATEVARYFDFWPPRAWPGSVRDLGAITSRQLVWLAGFVQGSIRARRVVL